MLSDLVRIRMEIHKHGRHTNMDLHIILKSTIFYQKISIFQIF